MNFAYGVIAIVGVLAAVSLGLIAASPDDIIEPRVVSIEERPTVCTMQWDPMCGIDGETYGNSCMLDAADVKLDYPGECVVMEPEIMEEVMEPEIMEEVMEPEIMEEVMEPEIMEEVMEPEPEIMEEVMEPEPEIMEEVMEPEPEIMEEVMESESTPVEFDGVISLPNGSGVPGCDETNECYIPFSVSISVGDKVTWSNDDSAAHTVTSGMPGIPDGNFDSSIFMAGNTFSITFNEAGDYPYYCMVHPWMIGMVNVS